MEGKTKILLFLSIGMLSSHLAHAALIETSVMGSYSKTKIMDGYNSIQRRYSGSIEFKFTPVSGLQFEYADVTSKISYPTNLGGLLSADIIYSAKSEDKVYSVNWVQNLVPSRWLIQPYFKVGGGRINRKQRQEYLNVVETATQKTVSGTAAVGLRIFLTRAMAIKGEFTTYVPDFRFSQWKDNQNFSGGLSWVF